MKVKSESEVTQSCPTLSDPMDCSPPGSSVHGIFQARGLEWGAIAFSGRIAHLTEHVKANKKDVVTRRSLLRLVGKRRQLLDYLKEVDIERYRSIVKELGLRR